MGVFLRVRSADRVSARQRARLARALLPLGLRIFGDADGWRRLLGPEAPTSASVGYGDELARLYNRAGLVIDRVHAQMPTAVSQRAFDVPACGGVLLADDRPDLREYLEIGKEALAYADPQDAAEQAHWWLGHDRARLEMAEAGRRRVLAAHGFATRTGRLLTLAAEYFGLIKAS